MTRRTLSLIAVPLLLFAALGSAEEPAAGDAGGPESGPSPEAEDAASEEAEGAAAEMGEEILVTLRVPLFSPLFASTPVASVEDEPIPLQKLTRAIASSHAGKADVKTTVRRDYSKLLDRILTAKLVVQEARNIGLDELPEVEARLDDFANQLLIRNLMSPEMRSVEPDPVEVDRLYTRMSREFLLTTIEFEREEDALAFQEQYEADGDFTPLAMRFFEEGRATGELGTERYVKLKDLLPAVAQTADMLEVGSASQIFTSREGFLIFYVRDIRPSEDPELREEARQRILEPMRVERAQKYAEFLEEKYATIDYELLDDASFEPRQTGLPFFRREVPVDYEALLQDDRVVATVHSEEPFTITVADLARKVERSFFHGVERALEERRGLDERKMTHLKNVVFKKTALVEARRKGLDKEEAYLDAVDENTTAVLFDTFVHKVVAPDVKISEEELQVYYREHTEEFSTPRMVRLDGLAFDELTDAESARDKIRRGADFRWVSANTAGQANRDEEEVLEFPDVPLSVSSLPEGLRERADRARRGDLLLYSAPDDNHYVILVAKVFPPTPRPYEQARQQIAEAIVAEKTKELVADWGAKLREAYEPRIFLQGLPE
jgi:hypothetical protein